MSPLRIVSACVVGVSLAAASGSPVRAQLLANGDFEAVTAGRFDSWTTAPGSGVASASAAPSVLGGISSAKLAAGGGFLLQTVGTDGIRHFAMEMDFVVFRDTADPVYQKILAAIRAAKARQERAGRYDMPGTRPSEHYLRWMKRFGVLPESFDPAQDPIDPYATDRAYWRSLWHLPPMGPTASEVSLGTGEE